MSVIIPVLNGARVIPRQLAALGQQTFAGEWELIVADNGSTDTTRQAIADAPERPSVVRVLDAGGRQGISHARNVAGSHARGRFLLFCDADDVVAPDWVSELVDVLETAEMAGGRLDYARLNDPSTLSWRPPIADRELPSALEFMPFAVGANFGVQRDIYEAIGGCDERFTGCDDVDLSWRVQLAGYRLTFAEDAVVHYQLRPSLRALARQQFAYGLNEARLFRKFREYGLRRPSLRAATAAWWFIASRSFHLARSSTLKGNWVREAAYRSGRLVGGARFRQPYW